MDSIRIIDARMGRGKTSAAINYMREHADYRFIYVTPYLDEVSRICSACGFIEPDDKDGSKLNSLKSLLREGMSVATTHALFALFDAEVQILACNQHYHLIMDEAPTLAEKVPLTAADVADLDNHVEHMKFAGTPGEVDYLTWRDDQADYHGRYSDIKELLRLNLLFMVDSAVIREAPGYIFSPYEEVIILTYMFENSFLWAFLVRNSIPYRINGVTNQFGYRFTETPDQPERCDYSKLLFINDEPELQIENTAGKGSSYAFSLNWYRGKSFDHAGIREARTALNRFLNPRNYPGAQFVLADCLWTCYLDGKEKLMYRDQKIKNRFLQVSARATNDYSDVTRVAYMVNRFADPNLLKFYAAYGVNVNQDRFALSEMLQFIWRSAIRSGKPIVLYLPSSRMRGLLEEWMAQEAER